MNKVGCTVAGLATAVLSVVTAQTHGAYMDSVLADGPRYYWNWDSGYFVSPAEATDPEMSSDNLGAGLGGKLGASGAALEPQAGLAGLGNAARFDGSEQDWYTAGPPQYPSETGSAMNDGAYGKWAIEFWMTLPSGYNAAANGDSTNAVIARGPNDAWWLAYDLNNDKLSLTGTLLNSVSRDQWHHVVLAADGTNVSMILDGNVSGELTAAFAGGFNANGADGSLLRLGSWSGPDHRYKGQLDELAIYNLSALDAAQYDAKLTSLAGHFNAVPEPTSLALVLVSGVLMARRRA